MQKLVWVVLLAIVGCAANPGAAPMGQGPSIDARQATTGFSGVGDKVEALREARKHCEALGKELRVVSVTESQPTHVRGKHTKVQLECLAKK